MTLESLRKIAESADQGEWTLSGHTKGFQGIESSNDTSGWIVSPCDDYEVPTDANAAHIATFNPALILKLLSDYQRMLETVRWYASANQPTEEIFINGYRARDCLAHLGVGK